MKLNHLNLAVDDVPAASAFLEPSLKTPLLRTHLFKYLRVAALLITARLL